MKATRRDTLMGALAVPAVAGMPLIRKDVPTLVVYDPALAAGRRLVEVHDGEAIAIEGDRIRLARALFERRPWLVVGVSRPADALLIEEVGREAGYRRVERDSEMLQQVIVAAQPLDKGLVLGWVLAPKEPSSRLR